MGWGFTSTKKQAFKILEKVDNGLAQVPESQQQKAELTVLANSQCGFWSAALTGGLRSSQMCAGDSTAQACTLVYIVYCIVDVDMHQQDNALQCFNVDILGSKGT